jgi:hypothetical protein
MLRDERVRVGHHVEFVSCFGRASQASEVLKKLLIKIMPFSRLAVSPESRDASYDQFLPATKDRNRQ